MNDILEKLWDEYFSAECAVIDTDEERKLMKRATEVHKKMNALLNKTQEDELEEYVNALHDANALFVKKAFFKGCEFAIFFLLELGIER